MPHLESRTQRHRNPRLIEQREYATGRLVGSFVWLGTGLAVWAFGYAFSAEFAWRQWPLVQGAGYVSGAVLVVRGLAGIIGWWPLAFQPVEPDEMFSRTYSEADPPAGLKIVQIDGKTLRMTDLGLSRDEADIVAQRLERARWYWSRHVLAGKRNEANITNLTARYGDMLAEMQRVGALESDGGRWRVAPWARKAFIEASPTLMNNGGIDRRPTDDD